MRRGRQTGCSSFRKLSNKIMELTALSIVDLRAQLLAKEVSPAEVLAALEARIARVDPLIHGYISRDLAAARRMAETVDVSLPLGGVPVALKPSAPRLVNALALPAFKVPALTAVLPV